MVRNDDFFLRKWVDYYGKELGRENLFIFYDGEDQQVADFCSGANVCVHPKLGMQVVRAEKERLAFLSRQAEALFAKGYDLVIGTDADEYIVVDPKLGVGLRQYLSEQKIDVSLSPLGLDVGQKLGEEGDLGHEELFLCQRHFAQIGTRYTKPSVISQPCRWGSGFHRVKGHNFHIAKDLYLLHFGYADTRILESRLGDADRVAQGWKRHIYKRGRTIRYVTERRPRPFDLWMPLARRIQTWCRLPYALNKPAMLGLVVVVELPERFRHVL